MAGMEVPCGGLDLKDRDLLREKRVQRLGGAIWRRSALGFDARYLTEGVDAGVGSAGDRELLVRAVHLLQRAPELALDSPQARLRGPAAEPRPVVFEGEL